LGYHPVAVVILHVHKYEKKVTRKFKLGGLHEKHVVVSKLRLPYAEEFLRKLSAIWVRAL